MASIDTTRPDHDRCRFVEEAESVDPMRRFGALSHQEEGHFAQDSTLDLFFVVAVEARQQSDHGVDGVALHLLHRITKLVDDHGDDHLGLIDLSGVGEDASGDVERGSLLELKLSVTHLL